MLKKTNANSIKNWSSDDQPREKLRDKGKSVLSDAELLAILIGSGNSHENAVSLCQRLFASVDHNLRALSKLSIQQLTTFKGIGEAKAITIIAAMELGRRQRFVQVSHLQEVKSSSTVYEIMQPLIGDLPHEEFWTIYLNNSNKILHKDRLSKGGITGTLVDVRLVLKKALELGATAIILAHNHPSGTLKPSSADKQLTRKLALAGESLDIKVLDHVIITEKSYFSFADDNLL